MKHNDIHQMGYSFFSQGQMAERVMITRLPLFGFGAQFIPFTGFLNYRLLVICSFAAENHAMFDSTNLKNNT